MTPDWQRDYDKRRDAWTHYLRQSLESAGWAHSALPHGYRRSPNAPNDRELSARLYGGDREIRISQEIVLGIGGVRTLRALGIDPSIWHINEGHAAFLNLERCRERIAAGLTFNEAREAIAANSLFTTHTPVPAGNDTFSYDLIDKYFGSFWPQLGLTRDQFLEVAREDHGWGPTYGMTDLALKLTGAA